MLTDVWKAAYKVMFMNQFNLNPCGPALDGSVPFSSNDSFNRDRLMVGFSNRRMAWPFLVSLPGVAKSFAAEPGAMVYSASERSSSFIT